MLVFFSFSSFSSSLPIFLSLFLLFLFLSSLLISFYKTKRGGELENGLIFRRGTSTYIIALEIRQVQFSSEVLRDGCFPATGRTGHQPYMMILGRRLPIGLSNGVVRGHRPGTDGDGLRVGSERVHRGRHVGDHVDRLLSVDRSGGIIG